MDPTRYGLKYTKLSVILSCAKDENFYANIAYNIILIYSKWVNYSTYCVILADYFMYIPSERKTGFKTSPRSCRPPGTGPDTPPNVMWRSHDRATRAVQRGGGRLPQGHWKTCHISRNMTTKVSSAMQHLIQCRIHSLLQLHKNFNIVFVCFVTISWTIGKIPQKKKPLTLIACTVHCTKLYCMHV